jgi:hypothetical protein
MKPKSNHQVHSGTFIFAWTHLLLEVIESPVNFFTKLNGYMDVLWEK